MVTTMRAIFRDKNWSSATAPLSTEQGGGVELSELPLQEPAPHTKEKFQQYCSRLDLFRVRSLFKPRSTMCVGVQKKLKKTDIFLTLIVESACFMVNPRSNDILNQMADAESMSIFPHLTLVSLTEGQHIYGPNDVIDQFYFPVTALIAIARDMDNGLSIDLVVIGNRAQLAFVV